MLSEWFRHYVSVLNIKNKDKRCFFQSFFSWSFFLARFISSLAVNSATLFFFLKKKISLFN